MSKLRHYRSRLHSSQESRGSNIPSTAEKNRGSPCIVTVLPEGYEWLDVDGKVQGRANRRKVYVVSPPWTESGLVRVRVQMGDNGVYATYLISDLKPIPEEPQTLTLKLTRDADERAVRKALASLRGVEVED